MNDGFYYNIIDYANNKSSFIIDYANNKSSLTNIHTQILMATSSSIRSIVMAEWVILINKSHFSRVGNFN